MSNDSCRPLVVHVLTSLDFGGVERHMEVIAGVLDATHLRHAFVAIGSGGAAEQALRKSGVEVICLGQSPNIPSIGAVIALFKVLRRLQPLVLHAHGAEANFHGLLAAWLAQVPVRVGEEIGLPSHSSWAKIVFRKIFLLAHRVIGVSTVVCDWLVSSGEVSRSRLVCLNNPAPLPEVRTAVAPDAGLKFRVCYVGRLEPVKNPLVLVKATAILRDMDVPIEVWIIGDGSQRNQIEREIARYGVAKEVTLHGFQAEPATFIRQSSVYVQPSLSEGFSLGLIEAMGCGVPVVVTPVGGAPGLIEPGVTGWLLANPLAETLAETLYQAWSCGEERLFAMGHQARLAVEGRFKPADYLAQLEGIYRRVAAEQRVASL